MCFYISVYLCLCVSACLLSLCVSKVCILVCVCVSVKPWLHRQPSLRPSPSLWAGTGTRVLGRLLAVPPPWAGHMLPPQGIGVNVHHRDKRRRHTGTAASATDKHATAPRSAELRHARVASIGSTAIAKVSVNAAEIYSPVPQHRETSHAAVRGVEMRNIHTNHSQRHRDERAC